MSRSRAKHIATYAEIREELRNAAEHLSTMMEQELIASRNLERDGDKSALESAQRLFLKEFKAFIGAVRSGRDYMQSASNRARQGTWFQNRLTKSETENLFEFFRLLVNQSLHQYRPKPFPTSKEIQVVADPGRLFTEGPWTITGIKNAKYAFSIEGLEIDAEEAYKRLSKSNRDEGIIELSARYLDELRQMVKNAERNGRFDDNSEATKGDSMAEKQQTLKEKVQEAVPMSEPQPRPVTRLEEPKSGKPPFPRCQSCNSIVHREDHGGKAYWVCDRYGRIKPHYGAWPENA